MLQKTWSQPWSAEVEKTSSNCKMNWVGYAFRLNPLMTCPKGWSNPIDFGTMTAEAEMDGKISEGKENPNDENKGKNDHIRDTDALFEVV